MMMINEANSSDQTIKNVSSQAINTSSSEPIELDSLKIHKNEDNYTLHVFDKKQDITKEQRETKVKTNFTPTQLMITNELKTHMKKNGQHNMIQRDQINQICENELTKSQHNTSLKDLHKIIHENSKPQTTKGQVKLGSTSNLDEYYDQLPKIRPVEHLEAEISNIPIYDCLPDSTVYDSPPNSSQIVLSDCDTDYLFPISSENLSEPCYMNANCLK